MARITKTETERVSNDTDAPIWAWLSKGEAWCADFDIGRAQRLDPGQTKAVVELPERAP